MEFTCCQCENKFNKLTGDVDERMCFDCLFEEEEDPLHKLSELMGKAIAKLNADNTIRLNHNSPKCCVL